MDDLTLAARFRVMAATGVAATIQPADLKAAAELLERAERTWAALDEMHAAMKAREAFYAEIRRSVARDRMTAMLMMAVALALWAAYSMSLYWLQP